MSKWPCCDRITIKIKSQMLCDSIVNMFARCKCCICDIIWLESEQISWICVLYRVQLAHLHRLLSLALYNIIFRVMWLIMWGGGVTQLILLKVKTWHWSACLELLFVDSNFALISSLNKMISVHWFLIIYQNLYVIEVIVW